MAIIILFKSKGEKLLYLILVSFLLFLSLLCKETGILFFALVIIFFFLNLNLNFKKILVIFSGTFFYLCLRFISTSNYFLYPHQSMNSVENFSLLQRLENTPAVFSFYLKEIFLPSNGIFNILDTQLIKNSQPAICLLFVLFFFLVIVYLGYKIWKNKRKRFGYFIFFLAWFLLGIGLHLQIFPLDAVFAARWLYFPLAGLLGILGFFYETFLAKKIALRRYIQLLLILLILLFCFQTITMNTYWRSEQTVSQHFLKNWN